MKDGIYFEVFAVKDGVRYNMKIVDSKIVSRILTDAIMGGVETIILPDTKQKGGAE